MKKIIASLFLLFLANSFYGQNKGITYQAVIYSPDAIVLPGQDNMLAPLTSQEVCMRFSFLDEGLTSEYEETITVITDDFGMVNLTLGQAAQSGGYASGFEEMTWDGTSKNLMIELDVSGNCFEFVEISNTTLSYVPFAMYAKSSGSSQTNATNIDNNTTFIETNTTAIALNTAKVGITAEQSDAILVNTSKVGYTDELVSANTDVVANTAKTVITAEQSDAILVNTSKVGYTDELVSANTDVAANTLKVGYTEAAVSANTDVAANTAKVGMPTATEAGQMNYWNGSAWITIAATVNEGATLQMIGGVPTWGGGTPPPHQIGDLLYGGMVFYIAPSPIDLDGDGDLDLGLVCAIEDQSSIIRWHNGSNTTTEALATAIGTGAANTDAIIAVQGDTKTDYAAGLARAFAGGGYTDWFLPSKDELNQMYINKTTLDAVSGFTAFSGYYWSSTEYDNDNVWGQDFSANYQSADGKNYTGNVRAVRAF